MKCIKFIILLFILSSCIETKQQGFYFANKEYENFDVFNFTKEDVISNIGYPNFELEDGTWLFYSYTTKNLKILRQKLYKEQVLLVSFDKNNKIKNYSFKEINNAKNLDKVITKEKEKNNFFKDLFNDLTITPIN